MRGLQKHIISITIAVIALIVGEDRTNSIELDNTLNLPSTTEVAYYSDSQELSQESPSQLISCVTQRTSTPSKRTNNVPKENYKIGYSKKLSYFSLNGNILKKPITFYFPFSDANLMLISFGKLTI